MTKPLAEGTHLNGWRSIERLRGPDRPGSGWAAYRGQKVGRASPDHEAGEVGAVIAPGGTTIHHHDYRSLRMMGRPLLSPRTITLALGLLEGSCATSMAFHFRSSA